MYGQLLFVDSSAIGNQKDKELVYAECKAHVAKNVHRRRRKAQRNSVPRFRATPDVYLPLVYADAHFGPDIGKRHESRIPVMSSTCVADADQHRLTAPPELYIHSVIPWNSEEDRLGNPAIASTPQMMNAIAFAQFHLVKSQAPHFVLRLLGSKQQASDLIHETESRTIQWLWDLWMSNVGLFSSVVASIVPLMTRLAPIEEILKLESLSMDLKSRSFAHLRNTLAQSVTQPTFQLLTIATHVKSLFRESCARGDTQTAQHHARMLEQLVARMIECDINCDRIALWSDALPALLQMRRPTQDFLPRMAGRIQQVWSEVEDILPNTNLVSTELPECVTSSTLREAFLHLRKALYITHVSMVAQDDEQKRRAEGLFQWLTTKAEHQICCLLHFYFNLHEGHKAAAGNHGLSESQRYVEMSFALCLLYLYQKSFFEVSQTDGTDVHESALMIYPLLREVFERAETRFSTSEHACYQHACFWICFIGCCVEEKFWPRCESTSVSVRQDNPGEMWFHSKLIQTTGGGDMMRWSAARKILDEFVWDKSAEPNTKVLFVQTGCQ